jgi:tripartite-type tricarboxylate transporter receptor subunit TctC
MPRTPRITRLAVLLLAFAALPALAQSWPDKPIKLLIPFTPGGVTDILGRLAAQKLAENLHQAVVVENRGGAGGVIGAEAAAKSPADGYLIFFGTTGTLSSQPAMKTSLPYDPIKSFQPISLLANAPVVIVVRSDLPVNSLQELIQLAKAKPGEIKFGSAGVGHFLHVAGEALGLAAGVKFFHVPYKGAAEAITDQLAGRIDMMVDAITPYQPHIKAGKLKPLAVGASKRLSGAPDIPTTAEAGLPGYEFASRMGLLLPAGAPPAIVRRLNAETVKALASADMLATLQKNGLEPLPSTSEEYSKLIVSDLAAWKKVVKEAKIPVE